MGMKTTEQIIAERRVKVQTDNLVAVKDDIRRARAWARDRWKNSLYVDEENTPSTLLDPPRIKLEFPDVDTLKLSPVSYGEPIWTGSSEYKLCWQDGRLYWVGNFVVREMFGKPKDEIQLFVGLARGKP